MGRTFFKADLVTRAEAKTADAKGVELARLAAYREVERRDGLVCRVCRRRVRKTLTLAVNRLEHHHIDGRGGLVRETTSNICVTCKGCHDDRHVRRVLQISGDANGELRCERDGQEWIA